MTPSTSVWCFLCLLFMAHKTVSATDCDFQYFDDARQEKENDVANISYSLNIKDNSNYSGKFKVLLEVCERKQIARHCTFVWKRQGRQLATLNWSPVNETTCFIKHINQSSSLFAFDIHISVLVRRSISLMKLSITDSDESFKTLRLIHLDVLYPPNVTSLTVNGLEVGDYFLINEGQNVTVSCSFVKGHPPAPFLMLDKHRQELQRSEDDGFISQSFSVKCEEDWPTVICKGLGSDYNRSVALLVRCPPKFVYSSMNLASPSTLDATTFQVKSHTAVVEMCLLTPTSIQDDTILEVNCSLYGNPPNFALSLHPGKEIRLPDGKWQLILRNEKGTAKTTLIVTSKVSRCLPVKSLVKFRLL